MDRVLARKLEGDEEFQKKLLSLVKDYLALGQQSLDFYATEFDTAHDILMGYAAMTKADLELLDRGSPRRFVLPMTSTQITTMTTFIAQMLFGDDQPHKVDGRGPEDETPAAHMNQLLRWNDEQQPSYLLGYLWIQDVLTYNRGIRYNCWTPIYETVIEAEEVQDTDPETGEVTTYIKPKRTRKAVAHYNHVHLVSPYDFLSDPSVPLCRMQEGRFAGHCTTVSWQELKRRSALPMDDPAYVSPSAVERLKKKKKAGGVNSASISDTVGSAPFGAANNVQNSRTSFERNRNFGNPMQDANKNDPGMVKEHELWIRLVPSDNELYEGDEPVMLQVLVGNNKEVLAVNEAPLKHDQFPYSAAEGRPSAYYQYSPSWVMLLKPIQDYVDYLKDRRQRSIARTGGNMFIIRPDKVNIADFLDPDKDGLMIPTLPGTDGDRLDDIVKQVPVVDQTKDFAKDISDFVDFSQVVSGVSQQMQGVVEGDSTATEFQGAQQMGAGRLSSVARLLSVQALVPETRMFVENYQQFLDLPMTLRFSPGLDQPEMFQGSRALQISSDTIQGKFDYIAHDGTLPGTDARKVAAIARLLEVMAVAPQVFVPAPGNIDPRALILAGAKASGLNIENFQYQADALPSPTAPGPMAPPPGATQPPSAPATPLLPDLANLLGTAAPDTGRGPGRPPLPDMTSLPSAAPPQVRPQNV
jgi:hypothetical protein